MNIERNIVKGIKDIDGIKNKMIVFNFHELQDATPEPEETLSLFHHVENLLHLRVWHPVILQIVNYGQHLR